MTYQTDSLDASKEEILYLDVLDLEAPQLLERHASILSQQTDPILQPADGGDGFS